MTFLVRNTKQKKRPQRKARLGMLAGVFYKLGDKENSVSAHSRDSRHRSYNNSRRDTESCYRSSRSRETEFASGKHHNKRTSSQRTEALSKSEDNAGGHWKSRPKRQKSSVEDDLSQLWAAAKMEQWAMSTRCHMFNSTLTGNARVWKAVAFDQRNKAKRWKKPDKGGKKEETSGKETDGNTDGKKDETEGPMIIKAEMGGHFVHRMYVDGGSSLEILYEHCFNRFCPEVRRQMIPTTTPLVEFSGEIIWPLGQISLLVKIGDEEHSTSSWINFMIVRMLKFPVAGETVTLRSSMIIPLECTMVSGPGVPQPVINQVTEEEIHVAIHPEYLEQTIAIGSTLIEEGRKQLCEHKLNIREGCLPVRQKKRGQAPERNKAIYEEVENWRMCVDFKDLNKACLKDGYPLLKIDWKVESLYGYPFKCFLDAYKGYHQIKMAKEDEEKTSFTTSHGLFCYSKMSFGLKNARATYQRLVDKAFQKQIGRNLEVYVDDLVIKSCTKEEVIRDIEETFKTLKEINMKLNPKKCTFRMREGTFLGYKVNPNGLKVCPDKVEAVLSLPSPKCLKDVKKLNGKLASLNRFLSKSAKKSLPFSKSLQKCTKKRDLQWTAEAKTTFKQMKKSIAKPSIKGWEANAYLLCRSCIVGPANQLHSDGKIDTCPSSASKRLKRAGLIITNPKGMEFTYALRFRFDATNNEAEYEALIAGLRITERMGVKNLQANVDSRLVANQVNKTHVAKEPGKGENKKADALSKIASTSFAHLSKQVLVEELKEKSIDEKEVLAVVEEEGRTWMTTIHEYCVEGILPEERKKARAIRRKARWYAATDGVLYKKSFLRPWLCCVGLLQANYVLGEIHEGSCNMHAGPRSVVAKALRSGYYWPTMHTDARKLTRECKDCQGIDIARPISKGPEAVIPVEIGMPTLRTAKVDVIKNDKAPGVSLDLFGRKKENMRQFRKQKAKPRWINTITPGSVTQAFVRETSSTEGMKQAV
nr:reverse transcriptase domain-containing protein [Tanacetum cinerariifolium]